MQEKPEALASNLFKTLAWFQLRNLQVFMLKRDLLNSPHQNTEVNLSITLKREPNPNQSLRLQNLKQLWIKEDPLMIMEISKIEGN